MAFSLRKSLWVSGLIIWVGCFAVMVAILNKKALQLIQLTDTLSQITSKSEKIASGIRLITDESSEKNQTLKTLQLLLEYMPQTESHVRSQKALMDDVQALRNKIGRSLKGRLHILVDTKANVLYLKQGMKLLFQADCSVGRGGIFANKTTGRRWEFITPRGRFRILSKHENPVWIKPDWAFFEEGQTPPPPNDPSRQVPGELGAYLLNLGDGYLIHGTKREDLLGKPASHGCVRLGSENLKKLFESTPVGTEVYIY